MSKHRKESSFMGYKHYTRRTTKIDLNNIVTTNEYHVPDDYKHAVQLVIKVYRSGIPFNKAVDQVSASYKSLNRNTLSKHTIKFIANDY